MKKNPDRLSPQELRFYKFLWSELDFKSGMYSIFDNGIWNTHLVQIIRDDSWH